MANVLPEEFHLAPPRKDRLSKTVFCFSRLYSSRGQPELHGRGKGTHLPKGPNHQEVRRLAGRFDSVPNHAVAHEFQATLVSCFLRASHSVPTSTRGATSIRRGTSLKTLAAFQGWPS